MKSRYTIWLTVFIWFAAGGTHFGQGTTAFVYQGQLHANGTNASGAYTVIFKLYDSVSGGNQAGVATTNNVLVTNGLFSANLDFGAGAFDGSARWLDITVQSGANGQQLTPRQQISPTPYSLYAATAATVPSGAISTAQLAPGAVSDGNIAASTTLAKTPYETNLVILRGIVSSGGSVVAGQGFSIQVTSSTNRTINFTTAFAGTPTITLSTHGTSGGAMVDVVTSTPAYFSTVANGSSGFEFIAIGPK